MLELIDAGGEDFMTLDHVLARGNGGADHSPGNLVTCCYTCNMSKARQSVFKWCKGQGWKFTTVRSRVAVRLRRGLAPYREAARVLLGLVPGVTMAQLVSDHDWIVKRQWVNSIDGDHWEHLQDQGVCLACGQVKPDSFEESP